MKGSNRSARTRKLLAALLLGAALACDAGQDERADSESGSGSPNVFVIVIDAASSFYLGLYGDSHATTPNLDRLARESVVFDQAYSQSATTTPSTASLVTGVRVMTHRVNARSVLPEEFATVAELFGEHGYTSYAFVGNPHAIAPPLGLHRGYDELALVYEKPDVREKRPLEKSTRFRVVLPEDLEESIFESLPRFAPWDTYAYFHYLQPHKPYDAPARYRAGEALAVGECFCAGKPCRCGDIDWDTIHEEFLRANETGYASPSTRRHLEALYRANLRYVDEALDRLLDRLREEGLYDDALIVVTSDHGEAFFGHQRFGHNRTLYDDMVRIPLVMKFPAGAKVAPRRIDALVETVDIVPTIFDFLGFEPLSQWEGESLWPLIEGREAQPRPAHREVVLATFRHDLQALRAGDHKYIANDKGQEWLYDLSADPDEQTDLARLDPERTRRMRERLAAVVALSERPTSTQESGLREDPEMDALLEALGYLRSDEAEEEEAGKAGGAEASP